MRSRRRPSHVGRLATVTLQSCATGCRTPVRQTCSRSQERCVAHPSAPVIRPRFVPAWLPRALPMRSRRRPSRVGRSLATVTLQSCATGCRTPVRQTFLQRWQRCAGQRPETATCPKRVTAPQQPAHSTTTRPQALCAVRQRVCVTVQSRVTARPAFVRQTCSRSQERCVAHPLAPVIRPRFVPAWLPRALRMRSRRRPSRVGRSLATVTLQSCATGCRTPVRQTFLQRWQRCAGQRPETATCPKRVTAPQQPAHSTTTRPQALCAVRQRVCVTVQSRVTA